MSYPISCSNCGVLCRTTVQPTDFLKECFLCSRCRAVTGVCDVCLGRFPISQLEKFMGIFCSEKCQAIHKEKIIAVTIEMAKEIKSMPNQLPLPFPPSALNVPKETLKIKVNQKVATTTLLEEWFNWLKNPLQTTYNRVEFKVGGVYVVFAKLKSEEKEDGRD
jgi:hypothetical protein